VSRELSLVLAVVVVVTTAPKDASAYCRTTTVREQDAMCGQVGEPLWWSTPCVSYAIDMDGSQWLEQSDTRAAIDGGFAAWSRVTCDSGPTDIQFQRQADSTCMIPEHNDRGGNVNIVAFLDPWIRPTDGVPLEPRALGITSMWFDTATGEIWGADIMINDERRLAHCPTSGVCAGFDLESIVTHEAGHFLGIGHSPVEDATMFNMSGVSGDTEMRSLEQDDIDAACTIYPPGSLQSECGDADFTPRGGLDLNCEDGPNTGGGGCSAAGGDDAPHSWSWTLLAFAFVFGLRRRRWSPLRKLTDQDH
jgi:MYXO-CTERM domain-containing protein